MNHDHQLDRDEARLAALIRTIDAAAPPPDRDTLARLRDQAAAAFDEAVDEIQPAKRRHPMFTLVLRGTLAASVALAAMTMWLRPWSGDSVRGAVPFSQVLNDLRSAETLHLSVVRDSDQVELWVRAPGLVRREYSADRYEIAAGSRLWKIDESANTVVEADSPWFLSPREQIDLLGLLDVGVTDATALLAAWPNDRVEYDGRECFVYRQRVTAAEGPLLIEAFADTHTKRLAGIIARDPKAKSTALPLAEMQLIAMNPPIADDKFVVAKSLTEDGRIGKISDAQGVVTVRPMLARRWTPVCREMLLKPGDWIRTDIRGANAVLVTLSSDVQITLGPGTLLECVSPRQARLHSGQVQVAIPKQADAKFELLAPREGSRQFDVAGKHLLRVDRDEKLVDVANKPLWLAGFEGTTNNESLGSLIVNLPDGRNEPLTVGYHKVNVEIRDQIARTTIEESFVNHTDARLEGIFHFPLPQDASISGFGMWIGNKLIEADVVEKQRAREIYETILRERRDPGLLEWTSGNLFKARVFPIEANSEKRVKIVYTQVLPLRANRYRYSYGLRSDLLRTKPLRELSLTVTVNSALPLKEVTCPTHTARTQQTAHSAQVEFAAQEYTPDRDFEVVCEVDGRQSDVVVVPHRRGDDGYFLVQITPPANEGNWQRELLPDGQPMNLMLLCDTSASMDSEKRRQQSEFVAAVLASLGPNDRFQLAAADVGTEWATSEPAEASDANVAKVREFLDARVSLGWTDLDRAFTDVVKKSPPNAHIIYVGDGIVSTGDADPVAFANRLKRLAGDNSIAAERNATFHAVSVGNTTESIVLKGIAAVRGGSMRSIGGEQTAASVALELLNEIAQPGLRDLNIEFRGLKVAAVYPERLPNLAAGTQQILVGRYLPEGKDQQGEIVVTGRRGSETVRYAARVSLADAEQGNSFIPRLWARSQLDHLLQQGRSQTIQDEIIGLSEEFHIITPYTSLLVLETDADRERFGVKRRYEMRDGERFFAEGRDNANYELVQQQMKRAGDWRIGLRRQILQQLATLGRNPRLLEQQSEQLKRFRRDAIDYSGAMPMSGRAAGFGGGMRGAQLAQLTDLIAASAAPVSWDYALGDSEAYPEQLSLDISQTQDLMSRDEDGLITDFELPLAQAAFESNMPGLSIDGEMANEEFAVGLKELDREYAAYDFQSEAMFGDRFVDSKKQAAEYLFANGPESILSRGESLSDWSLLAGEPQRHRFLDYRGYDTDYTSWVNVIFPALEPVESPPVEPRKLPEGWSPEAIALSKSLLRTDSLRKLSGGVELRRTYDTFDPRWNRRESHNTDLLLYSPTAWLTRTLDLDDRTDISFCDAKERGVFSLAFGLGRLRDSGEQDLQTPPLAMYDASVTPLHESHSRQQARVEPAGENRVILILFVKDSDHEQRYLIDTARHVILDYQTIDGGKVSARWAYEDFVEVSGSWWAKRILMTNEKQEKVGEITIDVKSLSEQQFSARMDMELAAKSSAQFLRIPIAKLKDARQRVADGSASFDDRMTMILWNASRQQWDEMWKHVEAIEQIHPYKSGVRWIRTILLATIRRNEEARQRLLDEARTLATQPRPDEVHLADFIMTQAYGITSWPEFLDFVELLKPVYERQPAEWNVSSRWQTRLLQSYDALNRLDDALALRRTMAEQSPWDVSRQTEYARQLLEMGRPDAAYAWLQKEFDRPIERSRYEDEVLWSAYAGLLETQVRWDDLLQFTEKWVARKPAYSSAYSRHLAALVFSNRLDAAYETADGWLAECRVDVKLTEVQLARLEAALRFAEGYAHNVSFYRMDERWHEPLADLARFFVRHPHHADVATRIVNMHYFAQSEAADRLRGEWLKQMPADIVDLAPQTIQSIVPWLLSGRTEFAEPVAGRTQMDAAEVPDDIWKKIAAALRQRWNAAGKPGDKDILGGTLVAVYQSRFRESEYLPFLRDRLASASDDYKDSYARSLFDALLAAPWTEQREREAFQMLRRLSTEEEKTDRLPTEIAALHRLVDAMIANRQSLVIQQLRDQGNLDELTRRELADKQAEIRRAAMAGVAARLAEESADEQGPLADWLRIEHAWLDVRLDQHLPEAAAFCWTILGDAPTRLPDMDDEDRSDSEIRKQTLNGLLRHRALITVMNLAARRDAKPPAIDRLLKYFDAGVSLGGDDAARWRTAKFQLLIALDRPDDLDRQLHAWIRDDVQTAPWRVMLARLVAERGNFDEAIQLLEAAQRDDLLTVADYRMLADLYHVADRRDAYERTRVESFKQIPENQLANMLYRTRERWTRTDRPLPESLDEETLFAMRALFEKSARPEQYLWYVREIYAASRDFRLLDMLPDAMLGRTPQQVYDFLQNLNSQVLSEVRNEATADEILARVAKLREGERTPTDLRALDLLEALVERKSSEVLNQPGPHVDGCLAALRRAFDREWAEGEPRQMADFLYNLGTLRDPRLVDEQLRELRALRSLTVDASRDQLLITNDLAKTLFWSYHRNDEAIRLMEAEVRDYQQANEGRWPHEDNSVLGDYVGLYEGAGRHAAGEDVLNGFLAKSEHDEQSKWLRDRLLSLYNHALEHDGQVSLGRGATLFANLIARAESELDTSADENVRYNIVSRIVTTFDIAHRHKLAGVDEQVRRFAFETMPVLLKRQTQQYRSTATQPVSIIAESLGSKEALRYVVERMEQYPQRLDVSWDNAWNAFGYELARHRDKASGALEALGDLESRVLKLAIAELKRHLRTGESRSQYLYHDDYGYFWREKRNDFARAANEVYAERRQSGRTAMNVARYLWHGLEMRSRAIEILLQANGAGRLDDSAREQLVEWLQNEKRFGESISIADRLVKDHPDRMRHRVQLMLGYFHTERPEQLRDLVRATDEHFHQGGRWQEGNIAEFAQGCLDCQLLESAVDYYQEAIALHQRNQTRPTIGDNTLSQQYQQLAQAFSALGRTRDAVDAASGAIVCWGPRHQQRADALQQLQLVLQQAKDLDGYVKHLDAEAAKAGQDSPILRKALGRVYFDQGQLAKAITQYELAVELQPEDKETHQALIECYDATKQRERATRQLLALIDFDRHDLTLYQQLAERLKDNEAEAERAATSIIEAAPTEAENHAALAELRQQQNRWDEAIPHWQQVAELRRLEPTGLLKLAAAQLHEKQWTGARESLDRLDRTEWPTRFSDVPDQVRRMRAQLPE